MLKVAQTLKSFFGGFDIPAYTLNSVPENTELPYITYSLAQPEWDRQASFYCQVWYRKNDMNALIAKADQILAAIGTEKKFDIKGGHIVIYPDTPLMQILTDEDSQRAYINLIINAYHMPGV